MNIVWDWENLKVKGKEYFDDITQDVGTDIDVVLGNLLTSDKLDDDEHMRVNRCLQVFVLVHP